MNVLYTMFKQIKAGNNNFTVVIFFKKETAYI